VEREMATYKFYYMPDPESGEDILMISYFPEVEEINLVDLY
jgi:hypothetical protein